MLASKLLLTALLTTQAPEDSTLRGFELTPYLGMYIPTRSWTIDSLRKETLSSATGFGLMLGHWLKGGAGVEIDLGFTPSSIVTKTIGKAEMEKVSDNILLANARFVFSPSSPAQALVRSTWTSDASTNLPTGPRE